jgi:hypothetical protein
MTKRAAYFAVAIEALFIWAVLHGAIKDFLYLHTWVLAILAALPGLAIPFAQTLIAKKELEHSEERNQQLKRIGDLTEELGAERNKYLAVVSASAARLANTKANRNADKLRRVEGVILSHGIPPCMVWSSPGTKPVPCGVAKVTEDTAYFYLESYRTDAVVLLTPVSLGEMEVTESNVSDKFLVHVNKDAWREPIQDRENWVKR